MLRHKYAVSPLNDDDFSFYFSILQEHKRHVRNHINLLTSTIRLANVYPTTISDLKERINHQNQAIFACVLLSKEMKEIVRRFDVNLNKFAVYQETIDHEIMLIKRWKQRDNRLAKRILSQGGI